MSAAAPSEGVKIKCEACGAAPYQVEGDEGRAKKELVCAACGHKEEAWVLPVGAASKWTLVDPTGAATAFASWSELLAALRSSGISSVHTTTTKTTRSDPPQRVSVVPGSRSATALLEQTPQPPPAVARPRLAAVAPRVEREAETAPAPPVVEKPAAAAEPAPASERQKIDRPSDTTGKPAKADDWSDDVEMISLRDLHVVVPPPEPPAPPPRGSLGTLPPPKGPDAPPPPTISAGEIAAADEVHEPAGEDDVEPEPAPSTDRSPEIGFGATQEATEPGPGEPTATEAKSEKGRALALLARPLDLTAPKSERRPVPRPAASTAEEPEDDSRPWLLPVAGIAIVAAVLAYGMRGTPDAPRPEPTTAKPAATAPQAPETVATPVVKPASTATANGPGTETTSIKGTLKAQAPKAEAPKSDARRTETAPTTEPTSDAPRKPGDPDARLSMPEQLEAASKARRSGDNARAKELYRRVLVRSPGNVEAYSGLGAVARIEGDQAAAQENFQRALASSPGFLPALIGLADVEWEVGDRENAKKHYRQYVQSASTVPDRARERAEE